MKFEISYYDPLGTLIEVDSFIATSVNNQIRFAKVLRLNPKTVRVKILSKKPLASWETSEYNKYPRDCVVLDPTKCTWYLLNS